MSAPRPPVAGASPFCDTIRVSVSSVGATTGTLVAGALVFPCTLGRTGVSDARVEGDGKTPLGCFSLRQVYYRPDRESPPETGLPVAPLRPEQGWCDDPRDPAYNREVTLPFAPSHEVLWREDALYDLLCVIGYNDDPVVPFQGSAIFLHVAPPEGRPTQGCVALEKEALRQVLALCGPRTRLCVHLDGPGDPSAA
ncbi:L,D-transpeptidase family protein [Phaeovibrio sulfidiphilus]|uniref:L,D-transpeptidase family protein n=1 Tax=Phaeovibrio sulfidiphilus TaxID=1220600 RepID=UPI0030842C9A